MATSTITQTLPIATQAASATGGSVKTGSTTQTLFSVAQTVTATFGPDTSSATAAQTLNALTQSAAATGGSVKTGSTVQTLPALTQTGVGDTTYMTLVSTVLASDSMALVIIDELSSTVLVGEEYTVEFTESLVSTVSITDEYSFFFSDMLTSVVTASGDIAGVNQTTLFTPRGMKAREEISFSFSGLLTSSVLITDEYQPIITEFLSSTVIAAGEIVDQGLVITEELSSTVLASDALYPSLVMSLESTVLASGDPIVFSRETAELVSTVLITDELVSSVSAFAELESLVLASDALDFSGSVANEMLHDTVIVYGMPWAKDMGAKAWVLNTETGGLSVYDNFQFTSIAEYKGVLYATSNDGIFALTGDKDDGRRVDGYLKTGFLDFQRPQTKRIPDIFVGYTGGRLEFDVETYSKNIPNEVYTYVMEEREADAPRNNRVKPGRGLSSRFWRFGIRNVEGAAFQIYDVTADVFTSKRRL